jgi:hypothetical protein
MVKEKRINDEILFLCEVCGLGYRNREIAEECEAWCRKTGTCSIEITRKAVYFPNLPSVFKEKMNQAASAEEPKF